MRAVAWVCVGVFAATGSGCGASGAFADVVDDVAVNAAAAASIAGQPSVESRTQKSDSDQAEKFLLFSGADLWRNGAFGYGGLVWSPGGIDREGFAAKLMLGGGAYRYFKGGVDILGGMVMVDAMPGWRFKYSTLDVAVFAGLDAQSHRLLPDDPGNTARGTHVGLRLAADLWWEPTTTTMVSAGLSYGSIGQAYAVRTAFGWRVFDRLYLGPEAQALGDETYNQWRIGLHATGLRIESYEWSAAAGYVDDTDQRSGIYGKLSVLTRR